MMMTNTHSFVSWEEHTLCQERGNRVVHYYLKEASGEFVLAVIGTERSIRHMMYVVSDEFVETYGSKGFINACTKWRARREVVEWLTSLVSRPSWSEVSSMLCYHIEIFRFLSWYFEQFWIFMLNNVVLCCDL